MLFTCVKSKIDTSFIIPIIIIIIRSTTAIMSEIAILLKYLALDLLLDTRLDEIRNIAVPST